MHALEMSFLCKLGLVRKVCSSRLYVNTKSYSRASRDDSCWQQSSVNFALFGVRQLWGKWRPEEFAPHRRIERVPEPFRLGAIVQTHWDYLGG